MVKETTTTSGRVSQCVTKRRTHWRPPPVSKVLVFRYSLLKRERDSSFCQDGPFFCACVTPLPVKGLWEFLHILITILIQFKYSFIYLFPTYSHIFCKLLVVTKMIYKIQRLLQLKLPLFIQMSASFSHNSFQYHYHHHVVLLARISLTLSRHFSLSFIASGKSSGLHPISSHSCWMYVRAGCPAIAWSYVGVHRSTSLMSSSCMSGSSNLDSFRDGRQVAE